MVVDDVTLVCWDKGRDSGQNTGQNGKGRDDEDVAECEANLEEAVTNQSTAVKVFVDKWFVNKGYAFGRAPDRRYRFHPRQRGASCGIVHDRH